MQWELLTPKEFEKLAKEEQICILPIGTLERHGEHMPFGTDALVVHKIAVEAAKLEPCVVFPPYYFGQIHEASCYRGAITLSSRLTLELLENICDQIGKNGFKKIVIINGHGGNKDMLKYFAISNLDRKVDYSLYIIPTYYEGINNEFSDVQEYFERGVDHAGAWETSMVMSVVSESVKLEYCKYNEPIESLNRTKHLGRIYTGLGWYGDYPNNVTDCPSEASKEKGEKVFEIYVKKFAEEVKLIKQDAIIPKLQKEFYDRVDNLKQ